MDYEAIKAHKHPVIKEVPILLDTSLLDEYGRVEQELVRAETRDRMRAKTADMSVADEAPGLRKQLEELTEKIAAQTAIFRFQALPRAEWTQLVADHPPSEVDLKEGWPIDLETIGPPLLAACAIDPVLTLEQAEEIWSSYSAGETTALFLGAWSANREDRRIPLVRPATGGMPSGGRSSTTPRRKASRSQPSKAGR